MITVCNSVLSVALLRNTVWPVIKFVVGIFSVVTHTCQPIRGLLRPP